MENGKVSGGLQVVDAGMYVMGSWQQQGDVAWQRAWRDKERERKRTCCSRCYSKLYISREQFKMSCTDMRIKSPTTLSTRLQRKATKILLLSFTKSFSPSISMY